MSTTQQPPHEVAFQMLTEVLSGKNIKNKTPEEVKAITVEWQQRAAAHIRAISEHSHLVPYHMNGAPPEEKAATYRLILSAIIHKNWGILKGQVAVGQRDGDITPNVPPPTPPTIQPTPAPVAAKAEDPKPRVAAPRLVPQPPPAAGSPTSEDALRALATALDAYRQSTTAAPSAPAGVDEDAVKEIVTGCLEEHSKSVLEQVGKSTAELQTKLAEKLAELVGEATKNLSGVEPRKLEVTVGGQVNTVDGMLHKQFDQVLTWVAADVPLWLWGAAGAGKTTMGRQLATALGLESYILSIDPTMTVGKLLGFRNMANGEFIEGFMYKPYKTGGLVLLDEIDVGDPGILAALNALLANGHYLFPNGETVARHPQFRVVAGANTKGVGAVAGYTARQRLDAATLNRFAVLEMTYDADLERAVALGSPLPKRTPWAKVTDQAAIEASCVQWVNYVQHVRSSATTVLVSPRASILGCKALRAGVPKGEVCDALVMALCNTATVANITNACGRFQ